MEKRILPTPNWNGEISKVPEKDREELLELLVSLLNPNKNNFSISIASGKHKTNLEILNVLNGRYGLNLSISNYENFIANNKAYFEYRGVDFKERTISLGSKSFQGVGGPTEEVKKNHRAFFGFFDDPNPNKRERPLKNGSGTRSRKIIEHIKRRDE